MDLQHPEAFTPVGVADLPHLERLVTDRVCSNGVDPARVRRLFERLGQASPRAITTTSAVRLFAGAFAYLTPDVALGLIEGADDLMRLIERVDLTSYLDDVFTPFYTLDELGDLTGRFIDHLRENRASLLRTGLPEKHFAWCFWLDRNVGEHYCQCLYSDSYKLHGILCSTDPRQSGGDFRGDERSLLRPPTYQMATLLTLEFLASCRERDRPGVEMEFPYAPRWRRRGSEGEVAYDEADLIDGLTKEDAAQLDAARGKLFDLKLVVLGRLRHAALSNSARGLWGDCLDALTGNLDAEEVDFLLRVDGVFRNQREILPTFDPRKGVTGPSTEGLMTGGLTQLLQVVGLFEQEITIGTFSRVRQVLEPDLEPPRRDRPQFFPGLFPPYFEFARYGALPRLDAALDLFLKLEGEASAFWRAFQSRVNDALANDLYENVSIKKRVKRSLASKFTSVVDTFANYLCASLEAGGPVPNLSLSVPAQATLTDQNIFRRDGDDWTVRYDGKQLLAFTATVGMFYVGHMINHPGKKFTASDLRTLHQQYRSGPSDAVYGKMDEQELDREGLSGDGRRVGGPVTDGQALAEMRKRLKEIEVELEAARSDHDDAIRGKLEADKEALLEEVKHAVGLRAKPKGNSGGKPRRVDLGAKRDRDAVKIAIDRELDKIEKKHSPLARHLRNSLQMQDLFLYGPDHPVAWNS